MARGALGVARTVGAVAPGPLLRPGLFTAVAASAGLLAVAWGACSSIFGGTAATPGAEDVEAGGQTPADESGTGKKAKSTDEDWPLATGEESAGVLAACFACPALAAFVIASIVVLRQALFPRDCEP